MILLILQCNCLWVILNSICLKFIFVLKKYNVINKVKEINQFFFLNPIQNLSTLKFKQNFLDNLFVSPYFGLISKCSWLYYLYLYYLFIV